MPFVRTIRPTEGLSPELGVAVFDLVNRVWPSDPPATATTCAQTLATWAAQHSTHCILTANEDASEVLAHALIFRREIFPSQGPMPIGALATVCVHPDHRGCGYGVAVVRAAFAVMPELGVEVALFQSPVPQFYEKLGARTIHNRFFNGQTPDNPGNPFWDVAEMIYPATFPWPEGDIDLNGEGY